jgi:mono/diheme cytochrome c family protein
MKIRKIRSLAALTLAAFWAAGFLSTSFSAQPAASQQPQPELTPQQQADSVLTAGRTVYLNNCNRCHALPDVHYYTAPRLTAIVDKMSRKAQLTPEQHDAVLKYLQTIRSI